MRKKFVYVVLIPFVVLCVLVVLFADRWITAGLEAAGEKAVGAKVEIDRLHLSLSPLGIRWARLQVANPDDPWRNIFETGHVSFAMDVGQLLRAKFIIETMEVNNLILDTKRTTDGSIPKPKAAEPVAASGGTFSSLARGALDKMTPVGSFGKVASGVNADSLLKLLDIRTLRHLDSLKIQTLAASQQWSATQADLETSKKKLAAIESGIASITPSQLNSVPALMSAIQTVDNGIKGVNEISAAFSTRKASIEHDVAALTASAGAIDNIAADDFARLKGMARLPNLNTAGIARLLVGDEMVTRALTYLRWVDFARAHVKSGPSKPPLEQPARMKGQDIHFPLDRSYPKLWIQKALISGGTDSTGTDDYIRARGEIRNITNDQGVTHLPLTASLSGVEGQGRTFSLTALLDRTKETPYDEYAATLRGVPLKEFKLGSGTFLAGTMTNAHVNSSLKVTVPGSSFDALTTMSLSGFSLQFAGTPGTVLERIVRETLQGIAAFDVGLRLWNAGGAFDVALSTDLDSKISERAQAVLGAEFTKLQNDLKTRYDAVVAAKRADVEKLVAGKKAEIQNQLNAYQSLLNDELAMMGAKEKELTDRLEKEQQGKLNDALKGLFKK